MEIIQRSNLRTIIVFIIIIIIIIIIVIFSPNMLLISFFWAIKWILNHVYHKGEW